MSKQERGQNKKGIEMSNEEKRDMVSFMSKYWIQELPQFILNQNSSIPLSEHERSILDATFSEELFHNIQKFPKTRFGEEKPVITGKFSFWTTTGLNGLQALSREAVSNSLENLLIDPATTIVSLEMDRLPDKDVPFYINVSAVKPATEEEVIDSLSLYFIEGTELPKLPQQFACYEALLLENQQMITQLQHVDLGDKIQLLAQMPGRLGKLEKIYHSMCPLYRYPGDPNPPWMFGSRFNKDQHIIQKFDFRIDDYLRPPTI
jgi:hypothetical protein